MKISLNNNSFWKWLNLNALGGNSSIRDYIEKIVSQEVDRSYIVEELKRERADINQASDTMTCLRNCLPSKYFHEILYCSVVYVSIFEKIFPHMARRVSELAAIEWMQYMNHKSFIKGPLETRYRDHLVHMFKTIYAGSRLLESSRFLEMLAISQFSSSHFKKWCIEQKLNYNWTAQDKKDIVRIAFFLGGLFHDFGYGHHYLCQYKKQLFELYKWMPCETANLNVNNNKVILRSLPSFMIRKFYPECQKINNEKQNLVVMGFLRDCLQLNHSIPSMLFIVHLAESLREARALTDKLYISFHIAAEAALIHDLTPKDNWLYLNRRKNHHFLSYGDHRSIPVGMLLALSDELSIWKRPRISEDKNNEKKISFRFEEEIPALNLDISTTTKTIKVSDKTGEVKRKISKLEPFRKENTFVFLQYKLEFN